MVKLFSRGFLVELESKHGGHRVLAVVALTDTIQTGRADSLVFVLLLLHSHLRDRFNEARVETSDVAKKSLEMTRRMWPDVAARNKQRAAREKAAPKGAATIKARAAEARTELRQLARELWERNPAWGVKDVVQQIYTTADQIQGRTYSAATIRRAIKGVRQEWRRDFEARGKKAGLYGLDR